MNGKVTTALASLNIPLAFMKYEGTAPAYIIFNVYSQKDTDYADNVNDSETNYVTLNFWYNDASYFSKIKDIKQLMKLSGFTFDGSHDLMIEDGYYGRNLDFIYKEFL